MSSTAYYLGWLAAGLVAVAVASAALTAQLRLRMLRRERAAALLDALARYCGWIAAQQPAYFFEGGAQGEARALHDVRVIQREWFPELADDVAQLLEVHARMIDFLWAQQALRLRDAEAWLELDHGARYERLRQEHRVAAAALVEKLELCSTGNARFDTRSTFPA